MTVDGQDLSEKAAADNGPDEALDREAEKQATDFRQQERT